MDARDDKEYLAWIDLETTGSVDHRDEIIEVGVVVTTADASLSWVAERHWTVCPEALGKMLNMDDVVVDMHAKSGLLAEVIKGKDDLPRLKTVDYALSHFLSQYLTDGKISLAGSGVSHFDKKFIDRYMPLTAGLLNYAPYDIGSVRRFLRLAGVPVEDHKNSLTHRALDDVRDHIQEARGYLALFEQLVKVEAVV